MKDAARLVRSYVEDLRARHHSKSSWGRAQLVGARLLVWLARRGVRDLRRATETHVLAYARHLGEHEPPLSARTIDGYLRTVKGLFAYLTARGVLLVDPARELRLRRIEALPRYVLTEEQARRLVEAPRGGDPLRERERALLELLYGTGLRLSEAVRLDIQDVDLLNGTLLVKNGKGRKDRMVPIPLRAQLALERYVSARRLLVVGSGEDALFLTFLGRRMGKQTVKHVVDRWARAARLPRRVTPHTLRHTCATHLLQRGAGLRHIQALLGHSLLETTQIYTRVSAHDLRGVLARAHPQERKRRRSQRR